jgi:hypothetical protein
MAKNNQWKTVGSLRKSQKGSFYIKINDDVTLTKGSSLQLRDPRKGLDEAVAAGRLSQEKADSIREKIPDYVKYDVILAPDKE